jgi:hypothetical protein
LEFLLQGDARGRQPEALLAASARTEIAPFGFDETFPA